MADDVHILDISPNDLWVERSADVMAAAITAAVERSGRCLLALSGGSTPGPVFDVVSGSDLPWGQVTILQVDERLVPADDPARNLIRQQEAFAHTDASWLPLPVDDLLEVADLSDPSARITSIVDRFCLEIVELAGDPPILDLVHLGLGDDGHTASLLPGDPLLNQMRDYIGLTGEYNGSRRLSMTRPLLDRARMVVWLVSGAAKADPLGRLLVGDMSIPAGLIRPAHSVVLADADAARQV